MGHPNGRGFSEAYGTQGGVHSRDKTECVNGHPYDEENTLWKPRKSRNPNFPDRWMRQCATCLAEARKRYRERKRIEKIWAELMQEGAEA